MSSEATEQVNMNAIDAANDWLYHDERAKSSAEFSKRMGYKVQAVIDSELLEGPEYPGDEVMIEAVTSKMRQWKEWKNKGMDIVAHSILDNVISYAERLKELT